VTPEQELAERLRRLEALHARPGTEGERVAAANALERLRARLARMQASEPTHDFRFNLPDAWARQLFTALARRYGLTPFRRRGQRATTVMLHASPSFVDQTLWPEFLELHRILERHLAEVTHRVIAQAVHPDTTEPVERPGSDGRATQTRDAAG
jgi:hypothetical protein